MWVVILTAKSVVFGSGECLAVEGPDKSYYRGFQPYRTQDLPVIYNLKPALSEGGHCIERLLQSGFADPCHIRVQSVPKLGDTQLFISIFSSFGGRSFPTNL